MPLWVAAVFLAIAAVTRLGLAAASISEHPASFAAWLRTLCFGALADLQAAAWVVLPLAIYVALFPQRWFGSRWHRRLLTGGLGAAYFVFYFAAVAEAFFFAEFDSRFNFVAVDYLMYPTEVGKNLSESYPLPAILAGVGALAGATLVAGRRQLRAAFSRPAGVGQRTAGAIGFALVAVLLTWALPPSQWRAADDRAINEIAANGWGSFARALAGSNATYEGLYATAPPQSVYARLRKLLAEPAAAPATFHADSVERQVATSEPERRWNVVVVLEESFGAEFVGALHPRPSSLTPRFDALAGEGVLWTRAYSTGNRTVRAIEATTASLPPLPGVSVVRRPQSVNLFTLPNVLREHGYQTLFVYGGRALFDGMGRYLSRNGVERIVEQSDFPAGTFATAWGVADEAIFDRALAEMDAMETTGRPFYSLVLSVSNHRPYEFPEGELKADPGLRRRENAVRYADHALGRFVDSARSHAFFDHTLFVLMGDHGARVYGAAEIPLASYEVPILFFAPHLLSPGRIETLASSLDVPPSILALLGFDYESRFFGHDLFSIEPRDGRALMTHNNEIALLRGSRIAVLGLHGEERVFEVEGESFRPVVPLDRAARRQLRDAIAYFYGADLEFRRQVGELPSPPPEVTSTSLHTAPARSHS
ncbi:MAG: sulfatase-like hydrolase/transferase [Thermoanaerobaculia bacterium]|nr:sulfatase-like hydrolase/transferase [Thermoanaerobaculia bacterium]